MWLDAWVHGEEERASLLWRGLPNHVILHILKLRTINKWKPKFDCVLLHLKLRVANIKAIRARERNGGAWARQQLRARPSGQFWCAHTRTR